MSPRSSSWLERDDETAQLVRARWTDRAKQRAAMWRQFEDATRLTDVQLGRMYARLESVWAIEDAIDHLIDSTRTR